MKLRVPDPPIAVAWLNTVMDEAELKLDDKSPLIVNPAMMACYGVKLTDAKSWALLGSSMEKEVPNALNAWYILSQAAKQYQNVKWPNDFTGYMWTWAALKHGDHPLWDEHVKQFLDTEKQAYSMLLTEDEENAYKGLDSRSIGQPGVSARKRQVHDVFNKRRNSCFGQKLSGVNDTATFDTRVVSNNPQTTATNQEAPLLLRLAFAACVPKGAADTSVSAIAQEALDGRLSAAEAGQVRVSQHLRKEVLAQLSKIQTVPTQDDFTRTLNNLAILHIVRTSEELKVRRSAPGADGVTLQMLRNLATSEQRRLLDCYNNIWWSGQVPEAWRTAIVAPILKSNKPANELSSYRPVSLTSAACKVMEAIALARLEWVARACGFLADQQTGFRRRRCTADSIADVVSTLEDARASGDLAMLLLIDVKGAFDGLPHAVVQQALDLLGIGGNLRRFLSSFLNDRTLRHRTKKKTTQAARQGYTHNAKERTRQQQQQQQERRRQPCEPLCAAEPCRPVVIDTLPTFDLVPKVRRRSWRDMAATQDSADPSWSLGRSPKSGTISGGRKTAALFRLTDEDSAVVEQWERKCLLCATLILLVLLILVLAVTLHSPRSTSMQGTSTAAPEALIRWRAVPETVAAAIDDDDEAYGHRATIRRVGPTEGDTPDATFADEKDSNVTAAAVAEDGNKQLTPPLNEMGKAYEWG
ncbi:hypothetical protein HPB49_009864 [Dermacentor silvarum]|uniref:Uncharacterized protein n=1 Tax=Dermacentor silvarum TaxID=543639 RepID=A0ACB8DCD7_DERSI|nr:hypothetical protein HPB49_009864 [Dermacentor silvarum]